MARVVIAPAAAADAAEIWAYIAEDNPTAADSLLNRFDTLFQTTAEQALSLKIKDEPNARQSHPCRRSLARPAPARAKSVKK